MHVSLQNGIRRVAIVDWDVHHGNGTEEIVRKWRTEHPGDNGLYFFSVHLADVELKKPGATAADDFSSPDNHSVRVAAAAASDAEAAGTDASPSGPLDSVEVTHPSIAVEATLPSVV